VEELQSKSEKELLDYAKDKLNFYLDVNLDKTGMVNRLLMFAV
jgi:hypothetical protein